MNLARQPFLENVQYLFSKKLWVMAAKKETVAAKYTAKPKISTPKFKMPKSMAVPIEPTSANLENCRAAGYFKKKEFSINQTDKIIEAKR